MSGVETATFGGGCFWCTEAVLSPVRGVQSVVSGYAGGHVPNPTYEEVCRKTTGHAEVVQVTFDPSLLSFRNLLMLHFATHDPTTPNRQGNDVGPQYRSIILPHTPEQEAIAREVIASLTEERVFPAKIVTEIVPFTVFYPAEKYHQQYFERNSNQPYCQFVIAPKVAKMRTKYTDWLKK